MTKMLFTATEAMQMLGLSRAQFYKIKSEIETIRPVKAEMYTKEALEKWVESKREAK
jgi:predicted DNA-binding transcriptional regulator AlpA